jgi:putative transposase
MCVSIHRKHCVRYNEPWHAHALTFSCNERRPYLDSAAKDLLVDSLKQARSRHGFDIWAYVIMPEHVHLLICPRLEEYSISRILFAVKRPVSYHAADRGIVRAKPFWLPGGGYDRNLWKTKTIHKEIDYIHANPVRRGLCTLPEEWPYSSAAYWAGRRDVPLLMDLSVPPKGP